MSTGPACQSNNASIYCRLRYCCIRKGFALPFNRLPTRPASLVWLLLLSFASTPVVAQDKPAVNGYWAIEDIKEGMKGSGKTVLHGTKIEEFEVEVLGIQRSSSPGRDIVLVQLKGCDLEDTGIIAGMSGSPVYVDGKLLGAVAYGWSFGKKPIAGVTPFAQMVSYASNLRKEYVADARGGRRVGTMPNLRVWDRDFRSLLITQPGHAPLAGSRGMLGLSRIKMPLVASGFSPRSMSTLSLLTESLDMIPVLGGRATGDAVEAAAEAPLEPGSPLSVALVTGDFNLSGIGTVTHVEGDRVYGYGHPMFSLGKCELPLMSGYIHVVYPSQSLSFKMGSPLRTVGVIDTDVSTCIAGHVGQRPRMVPMEVVLKREAYPSPHRYQVQVVRQPELLPSFVYTVLLGAIDTEGNLPDEMTVRLDAVIQPKGHRALKVSNVYSGERYTGFFAPMVIYSIVPNLLNALVRNPFQEIEIESIRCVTEISEGRSSASIRQVRLDSDIYQPGDKLVAKVELDPYKGAPAVAEVSLDLPANLAPGRYQAVVCDALTSIRSALRNRPHMLQPQDMEQLYRVLELQLAPRRQNLYLRVMTRDVGVALKGEAMPNLPRSVAQILSSRRRSGTLPIRNELVATTSTPFVVQGSRALYFTVVQNKKIYQ